MISWNSPTPPALPGKGGGASLFDTTRSAVVPVSPSGTASLYVCGITPYDATHMGHAATYVAFDLLNRLWRDAGLRVQYVQNVTDIDDPLLDRANELGVDWEELAAGQTDLFRRDMAALNVLPPDHFVGAVESIEWLAPAVEKLVEDGLAYPVKGEGGDPDGDIYFSVDAAGAEPDNSSGAWWLGQISGLSSSQMMPLFGERGGDPGRGGKRNALDPLLWRVARAGEPQWDGGSLGAGRPGWHIECTVISQRFLPAPFTVQGGGSDLVFPHHEMGAGHAYAISGIPMADYYVHTGMVGLDGEKMSKSKGNLVLVSSLREAGVEPAAIRLAILASHYRADWFWTEDLLREAQERISRWREAMPPRADPDGAASGADTGAAAGADTAAVVVEQMRGALATDLDAPAAVAAVDKWVQEVDAGSTAASALVRDAVDALLGVRL